MTIIHDCQKHERYLIEITIIVTRLPNRLHDTRSYLLLEDRRINDMLLEDVGYPCRSYVSTAMAY